VSKVAIALHTIAGGAQFTTTSKAPRTPMTRASKPSMQRRRRKTVGVRFIFLTSREAIEENLDCIAFIQKRATAENGATVRIGLIQNEPDPQPL